MQHLKHCLNPKVIAGVVVVAAAVWVFAPGAFAAAMPLLVLAICPFSMLVMAVFMRDGQAPSSSAGMSGHDEGASQPSARVAGAREERRTIEARRARVAELEHRRDTEPRPAAPQPVGSRYTVPPGARPTDTKPIVPRSSSTARRPAAAR